MGATVSGRAPLRLDVEAVALRGIATPLAAAFTVLGRAWPITAVALSAAAVTFARHADLRPVAFVAASQVLSQTALAASKRAFRRVRPVGWLLRQEPDLSYPSGHAATAVVFYGWLTALALHDRTLSHAATFAVAAPPAVCVPGLPWSRLALGAHYATDVLGGVLFGVAWSCAAIALLRAFALT